MALKQKLRSIKQNFTQSQDRAAQRTVLDELFNDYYRSRRDVYKMNFIRGIFLGLGTALGGTVVLAIIIYVVGLVSGAFFGDGWLEGIRNSVQNNKS